MNDYEHHESYWEWDRNMTERDRMNAKGRETAKDNLNRLRAHYMDALNNEVESPLAAQVGGDHYKKQGLQPFEITFANFGYAGVRASVYTKVNKYLTRDKNDHMENIEKAIHCLQIQLEFLERELEDE